MNDWSTELTGRELKEIAFAQIYHDQFEHGTDGHNRLILISKLVALLNKQAAWMKGAHNPADGSDGT